jgi:hypothetical protein
MRSVSSLPSSSALQPSVGLRIFKQMSPTTSIPGIRQSIFQSSFLRLPVPCQSILISIDRVLVALQGLSTIFFLGNSFSSIRSTSQSYLLTPWSQWRTGGRVEHPTPKFRSFAKAEPNSQFHGIYIRNNLIRIWGSFI